MSGNILFFPFVNYLLAFGGFSSILLWNFKHTAKLKEFYSEHLYIHPLDSTINILPYLFYHMFICLWYFLYSRYLKFFMKPDLSVFF